MESQASLTTAFPNDTNFTDGTLPKTLSAVTASLSLMGSFTIFLTFWMSPDLRTTARRMIMFITVADFLFFHITAWGVPFVITVAAYFFNGVQFLADLETGYKCWIWNEKTWQAMCIWAAITGEGWAIMTYITMTVFYVLVKQHIRREVCKKLQYVKKKFD